MPIESLTDCSFYSLSDPFNRCNKACLVRKCPNFSSRIRYCTACSSQPSKPVYCHDSDNSYARQSEGICHTQWIFHPGYST